MFQKSDVFCEKPFLLIKESDISSLLTLYCSDMNKGQTFVSEPLSDTHTCTIVIVLHSQDIQGASVMVNLSEGGDALVPPSVKALRHSQSSFLMFTTGENSSQPRSVSLVLSLPNTHTHAHARCILSI